jgi:hypothetical protein
MAKSAPDVGPTFFQLQFPPNISKNMDMLICNVAWGMLGVLGAQGVFSKMAFVATGGRYEIGRWQ